jgi:signal transduction histidine kinase
VSCLPPEWAAEVSVSCDPMLPPVWADHDRLEQVFVNLLGNAFRHNSPGTRVEVSAAELPSREVEVTVLDDGAGFPSQLAAAPFEPARRSGTRSAGAGLGLSIARGIVDAHGGTIRLEPARRGTRFAVRLPVEAPAQTISDPAVGLRAYA